jgi:hypothetical protein
MTRLTVTDPAGVADQQIGHGRARALSAAARSMARPPPARGCSRTVYAWAVNDTTPIAVLSSPQGADEAVELLHGNGIKCAVADPVLTTFGSNQMGSGYTVIVATEDKKRAKQALEGMLAAKWFLRTSSGQRYHAFETAT